MGRLSEPFFFQEASIPDSMQSHCCDSIFNSPCCLHCKAYRWAGEHKSFCCCNGKVQLDLLQQPPCEMIALFDVNRSGSTFLENIIAYNKALALASLGCNEVCVPGFIPNFMTQGKIFHRIGSLLPAENRHQRLPNCSFTTVTTNLPIRASLPNCRGYCT